MYKLEDSSMTGLNRKWVNRATNVIVWWNCEDDKHRWELAVIEPLQKTAYYYALDPDGSKDPWLLEWHCIFDQNGNPIDSEQKVPHFESGMIDLRYLDLFPSYSSDLHQVMDDITLRQAMRALFPVDHVKDGDTAL